MQKTTVHKEGARSYEFLLSEGSGRISRDEVTLKKDDDEYVAGTVLKLDGDKMVRFDGTGDVAGILCHTTMADVVDAKVAVIARLAEVDMDCLVFKSDATTAHKDAAKVSLASNQVIVRG